MTAPPPAPFYRHCFRSFIISYGTLFLFRPACRIYRTILCVGCSLSTVFHSGFSADRKKRPKRGVFIDF